MGFALWLAVLLTSGTQAEETASEAPKLSQKIAEVSAVPASQIPRISVRRTEETSDASLYVELNEVLKIRSSVAGLTPYERVKRVQERLNDFLRHGGNPREIKPGHEGKQIVIRAGEATLVTIDPETARKARLNEKQLAYQWTNLIRKALGAEPLKRDSDLISSRGFSPGFNQARNLSSTGQVLQGLASWYGPGFHGRRTASGERFDMHALTAAHRTLPLQTRVKVTNVWNGKSIMVRITDRGPFIHNRIIDLSKGAAQAIGMLSSGTAPVIVEVLGR